MAGKTAKQDITVENVHGQQVVLVHAGQPVPANIDELKAKAEAGVVQTASSEDIERSRGVQDKARRSSKGR